MVPLFLVPAVSLLFFYVSTFRSMLAVPNMAVFCTSLTSLFPGMSLTYYYYYYFVVIVVVVIVVVVVVVVVSRSSSNMDHHSVSYFRDKRTGVNK